MSDDTQLPEPDRSLPAPHPRHTRQVFGQDRAEAEFLVAFTSGRKHHAWLLTGARGVGKATLAWRIARFLLATPPVGDDAGGLFGDAPAKPETLEIPQNHPAWPQTEALSHPGLFLLRRGPNDKGDKLSAQLRINEVRRAGNFTQMAGSDHGARVMIVDAADEMNTEDANAFLKMLEVPPEDMTILLVSHQPARLLPTIRSRCRTLALATLNEDDVTRAVAQTDPVIALDDTTRVLAAGAPGEAVRLLSVGGAEIYTAWLAYFDTLERPESDQLLKLADAAAARGAEARLDATFGMLNVALGRLALFGAGATMAEATDGEFATFAKLCPTPHAARIWAQTQQELNTRATRARAVNLDPAAVILDMGHTINQTASSQRGRP